MKNLIIFLLILISTNVFSAQNRIKIKLDKESIKKNHDILEFELKEKIFKLLKSDFDRLYNSHKYSVINGSTPVFTDLSWSTLNSDTAIIKYTLSGISSLNKTYFIKDIYINDSNLQDISGKSIIILKITVTSKKQAKVFKSTTLLKYKFKYKNGNWIKK